MKLCSFLLVTSFKQRARNMDAGKLMTSKVRDKPKELRSISENIGEPKKAEKCLRPTNGLPQKPLVGQKSRKAIWTPYSGQAQNTNNQIKNGATIR